THTLFRCTRATALPTTRVLSSAISSSFKCCGPHRDLHSFPTRRSSDLKSLADAALSNEVKALPAVPPPEKHWLIKRIDQATKWGLLIIGGCLMLGLFSRTAAIGGALFLLMTLLTHPPLPWYPDPPNAEGHYVFISKNVIELLALLMLACI